MNKNQAAERISALFQSAFNRDDYIHFLRNLLNDVEPRNHHYSGNMIPNAYKQHVNQYWRIGKYTDPEEVEMDLYVVEVKSLSKLIRARTKLRNFAVRTMQTFGGKDHALIASYAKEDNGIDWRFSYVKIEHSAKLDEKNGKVKTDKELTPAKRFSYLVGEHENSHTAQAQLVDLLAMDYANPTIEEIEEAFSIEKVTKEFFEQYKDLFIRLSEVLAQQPYFLRDTVEEKRKQVVAKFAKKLLGQIVFLYFIQKKGWLGVKDGETWGKGERRFLQKLFADADESGQNYYVEKLQYLFYEALASDRKDQFDPSYYKKFDCRIPFLNGGLFEADYDWQKIRIEIPNAVFFNNEKTRADDKGTGIINVFDRYNFTIKEDDPLDKEVAVDPEMLGKVFENMLEITERKSKGAFYTPREIVHYMCQESLIHYLNGEVGDTSATAIPKGDIEFLVRKGIFAIENDQDVLDTQERIRQGEIKSTKKDTLIPQSIQKNAGLIDEKLADIKICDPAIGSGAFPVGMLHEILHARQSLAPHLSATKRLSSYDLKKHTIGNSIYGVDIDSSAIDIARLRLWLSLVVDEEDYATIDALPNLDYKIMQGNSLIEEFEGVKLFDESFIQDEYESLGREKAALKQRQTIAQSNFFAARNAGNEELETKYDSELKKIAKALQDITRQRKKLAKERETKVDEYLSEARKQADHLESLHQKFFDVTSPAEKRKLRVQITTLEWKLIEATLREKGKTDALTKLAEYKTSGEKPWFLWKLNFSEVFKQKGGFDVVIGNPPYGAALSDGEKNILKVNYSHLVERIRNSFLYFTGLADVISKPSGTVSYIIPNEFLFQIYMSKARAYFLNERRMLNVINVGESAFEAIVPTCIIMFGKERVDNNYQFKGFDFRDYELSEAMKKIYEDDITFLQRNTIINANKSIYSFDTKLSSLAERIRAVGSPLFSFCDDVANGISTSCDGVYVIDHEAPEYKSLSGESLLKPTIKGGDFQKFRCPLDSGKSILYVDKNTHIDAYPESYRYLSDNKDLLISKSVEKKQGKRDWHLLFRARKPALFLAPKVIARQTGDSVITAVDEKVGYYCIDSVNVIAPKKEYRNRCLSLSAILNSSVSNFYYQQISQEAGRVLAQVKPSRLKAIPINLPFGNFLDFLYLYVSKSWPRSLISCYFEQLIDGLVYELYFPEEIKAAGKEILQHLGELTPLAEKMNEEEKLAVIQQEFERLYDPNHPVRNHLETLDSVEEVRIIREALKK